jgi:hypothetical protein
MKQQGRQTKRGTSQRPVAAQESNSPEASAPAPTKPGVAKPMQRDDYGQGATDFHPGNHGKRGR